MCLSLYSGNSVKERKVDGAGWVKGTVRRFPTA